jgi:hypothetical protein
MPTTNDAVAALANRVGFTEPRARAVARRLTDAGVLPAGGPGRAPEIAPADVISLFIALAADAELRRSAEIVTTYGDLVPDGIDVMVMPESIRPPRETARTYLNGLVRRALQGDADMRSTVAALKIEVVSNWPAIAIHFPDGEVQRFREVGSLASHWQESGHRKSTTVSGAAFVDAIRDLNFRN